MGIPQRAGILTSQILSPFSNNHGSLLDDGMYDRTKQRTISAIGIIRSFFPCRRGTNPSISVINVTVPPGEKVRDCPPESTLGRSKSNYKSTKRKISEGPHLKPPGPCGICGQAHFLVDCTKLKELILKIPDFKP